MDINDGMTYGLLAVKAGLISQQQLKDALEEVKTQTGQVEPPLPHLRSYLERKNLLTNFQSSKLLKGETEGFVLGGYRILYKISSGSFGRVFRAVDNSDPVGGRVVAIKVLRRRWSEDQQRIDLFIREGKMGLTLKHPHIVEVLAINQDPTTKQYFLVMEFVEGGNLREILDTRARSTGVRALSPTESLKLMEHCADGMAFAYSKGLTHRDVKLTNILVASNGEAKLVDFGLAQMFASIGREEEQVDRTVDYAGLEKATGVKQGDVRSDIFFLGCVLFEMLTGRAPLEMSKDRHARMAKRRFESVQSLNPSEIKAPAAVYQLVESMLCFDPRRRLQTPAQLLDAVRAAREEGEGAAPGGDSEPTTKGRKTERTLYLVEANHARQEKLRKAFKDNGYRVLVTVDPDRAIDRFRQQPFDVLLIDAEDLTDDAIFLYEMILSEAKQKHLPLVGILILGEEQASWASRVPEMSNGAVLILPDAWKELPKALKRLQRG